MFIYKWYEIKKFTRKENQQSVVKIHAEKVNPIKLNSSSLYSLMLV